MNNIPSPQDAARKLIKDNPDLFNKFCDKELQIAIIALALLNFSVECDKAAREVNSQVSEPVLRNILNNTLKP